MSGDIRIVRGEVDKLPEPPDFLKHKSEKFRITYVVLKELLETQKLNQLFYDFHEMVGVPVAIIDLEANVLASSNWMRLCTDFHRVNPETCARCIESDTELANQLERGSEFTLYRCKNGLTDCASPIVIEGDHVANLFIGQFLLEQPDKEFFKQQAEEFGFPLGEYMGALEEVPVLSETKVPAIMGFLVRFAQLVAEMGLEKLHEQQLTLAARFGRIVENSLNEVYVFDAQTLKFNLVNHGARENLGYSMDELKELAAPDIKPEFTPETFEKTIRPLRDGEMNLLVFETTHQRKDGSLYDVEVHLQLMRDETPPVFVAIIQDITERKQAENKLQAKTILIDAIQHLQSQFITKKEPLAVFQGLLDDMLVLTDSEYGFVGEVLNDPDGNPYLITHAFSNLSWDEENRQLYDAVKAKGFEFHNLDNLLGQAITSGEPVISNDPTTDPRRGGFPKGHPSLNTFVGIPVYSGDRLVGEIGLANRKGGYNQALLDYLAPLLGVCGQIIVARQDQTEELMDRARALTEELAESKNDLERSNDELEQFVYTVSHDLKSPLATSMGFIGIIQKLAAQGKLDEAFEKLDRVVKSNERMGQLINDLLDLSRVGRIDMDKIDIDLNELLATFYDIHSQQLEKAGFTMQIDPGLPVIYANESRMLQLFENLLSNALKYASNPDGSILSIGSKEQDDASLVWFRDNGPGIPEEYHEKIFALFYRLNPDAEGSGVGLTVAAKVMKFHNGKIWVESTPGEGATFWLSFGKNNKEDGE